MNDIRKNTDSFGKWKRWWLKVESVPLDPEKLTADVPQSLRCLLTPSLWGYKGGGAVAEIKGGGMIRANDGVSYHYACRDLVSLWPSTWSWCLVCVDTLGGNKELLSQLRNLQDKSPLICLFFALQSLMFKFPLNQACQIISFIRGDLQWSFDKITRS